MAPYLNYCLSVTVEVESSILLVSVETGAYLMTMCSFTAFEPKFQPRVCFGSLWKGGSSCRICLILCLCLLCAGYSTRMVTTFVGMVDSWRSWRGTRSVNTLLFLHLLLPVLTSLPRLQLSTAEILEHWEASKKAVHLDLYKWFGLKLSITKGIRTIFFSWYPQIRSKL